MVIQGWAKLCSCVKSFKFCSALNEFGCVLDCFPFALFPSVRTSPLPTFPNLCSDALSTDPALKTGFEFQRISIDRSKMSEEEAFEHAIDMIQTRQMGFRKAADFFSVCIITTVGPLEFLLLIQLL